MDALDEPLGDEDLIDEYTNGFCHVLALALHDLLGMYIGLLSDGDGFRHYVAYTHAEPDMLVDINGRRPLGDLLSDLYLSGHDPEPEVLPQTRAAVLSEMGRGKPLCMPNRAGLEEAAELATMYGERLGMTVDQGRLRLFLELCGRPSLDEPRVSSAAAEASFTIER